MALKRSELKALVKECLVEVLEEGLAPGSLVESSPRRRRAPKARPPAKKSGPRRRYHPGLDTPVRALNEELDGRVRAAAGGDNVMAGILADTARTTLQEQNGRGHSEPSTAGSYADGAALAVGEAAPEDLFGEIAGNWSALAFADGGPAARGDSPASRPSPHAGSTALQPGFDPYESVDSLIVPDQ